MFLGSAWYPEHWPRDRWQTDLEYMAAANMNVVRVAEFAWSRLEPEDGAFDLNWLQEAVELAAQYGLKTVIGTPSAAPPIWLTERYPEVLSVNKSGIRAEHGGRCHYVAAHPTYRWYASRIAGELAQRFGNSPHVIGWQIDNEYNQVSYDDETHRQFQAWLADKFGDIDNLNERWATNYWSQTYADFAQIPLPKRGGHPALVLEFNRFMTDVYRRFQAEQIAAIRAHAASQQWITHNFVSWKVPGWWFPVDYHTIAADIDLASWDNYVITGHLDPLDNGLEHDLMRGLKRRNFWVMETQPGWVHWGGVGNALNRGEVAAMAWHAVGHGADGIVYWQWRSAPAGQETNHGCIIGADGKPRPIYDEIAEFGAGLAKAAPQLTDTTIEADIALLFSFDDLWTVHQQRHNDDFDVPDHFKAYYRALRARVASVDVISPNSDLDGYKLVIAPNLHTLNDALADRLRAFVENGGHLVIGTRSIVKDTYNMLLHSRPPGPLSDLTGATVREFYSLLNPVTVENDAIEGGHAHIWAEWLGIHADDAETLLRYGEANGWLDGQAAAVTRAVGEGRITQIGFWPDDVAAAHLIDGFLADQTTIDVWNLPAGVELSRRTGAQGTVHVLVNCTPDTQKVNLPEALRDLLTDIQHDFTIEELAPYQTCLLVRP